MNRLQSELHRLYLPGTALGSGPGAEAASLVDARGMTRAMVLEIAGSAGWEAVARVWRGCQLDLELPAPAIAVSGADGFQLWFSLAEPVSLPEAHAFLQSIRMRYLTEVGARHVRVMPAADASSPNGAAHAAMVPAAQAQEDRWSAFVAPDLAPLFSEAPWLDIAPGIDGQADLLCRLGSIGRQEFEAASARLRPASPPAPEVAAAAAGDGAAGLDPRSFLLQVMRDDTVALALRIE
ncbi:MAG TPA: hypothetical protein VN324_15730, partial [Quisquiliibacterium sp.]|nr:hypothetical protein [Quisquiliibacterium sp.]